MARSRVMSFMSGLAPKNNSNHNSSHRKRASSASFSLESPSLSGADNTPSPDAPSPVVDASPAGTLLRRGSRPASTMFTHKPPQMRVAGDTPAELQPIFGFLNSHANKLYQEGYFLKLNDLDSHGRPCPDRQWVECYAQLIGTVLSLWNAAALDAAPEGQDVPPTFINLSDASIKMIETLPTKTSQSQPLKNVLSLCSAGQNRYLLHFNSFNSLVQWAAAIRLAMYEQASLYEAYTGSIIAGKGKTLNNVNAIMERTRFKYEDYARVRFGAGTPWRRCWFVVSPPDEKEAQKARKTMKRQSAYDRSVPIAKGNIKFYETKKTKKSKPIATITYAYSAYAIYPQSIPLIDQSTLIKIEGEIAIGSPIESTTEGLVFVMPETHAAVSGFETMLRFLISTFDTFHLYGRPNRLIAATNHIKSIMFAFPKNRRYGYLDILDIATLMQSAACQNWSEAEWRKQLKEVTMRRMSAAGSEASSISSSKPYFRANLPNRQSNMRAGPPRLLSPSPHLNQSADNIIPGRPRDDPESPMRAFSDITGIPNQMQGPPRNLADSPVPSVYHLADDGSDRLASSANDRSASEKDYKQQQTNELQTAEIRDDMFSPSPPAPVSSPPAFTHGPGQSVPLNRPRPTPDLKENKRFSNATFMQLQSASNMRPAHATPDVNQKNSPTATEPRGLGVSDVNWRASSEVIAAPTPIRPVPGYPTTGSSSSSGTPPASIKNRLSLDTSKAIKRKPAPPRSSPPTRAMSPGGEPSLADLRHTVDEDALNKVGLHPSNSPTDRSQHEDESVYDDVSVSTHSPDYASTHESIQSERTVPRARMGVMKTVGGEPAGQHDVVVGDAHYSMDQQPHVISGIPNVDFGPTMTYLPATGRPNTAETLKHSGHERNGSDSTERQRIHVPTHSMENGHERKSSRDNRRRSNIPWQQGMSTPGTASPSHAHQRTASGTPPPRHNSANWMPSHLNQLSAREQQHVARMTNSSFFSLSSGTNNKHQPQVNSRGLVGQIDAREREKRGMKEGMSNHMVQHAIAQRQQHSQQCQDPRTAMPSMYGAHSYNSYHPYTIAATGYATAGAVHAYRADERRRRQTWYAQPPQAPPAATQPMYYHQPPSGHFGNMS